MDIPLAQPRRGPGERVEAPAQPPWEEERPMEAEPRSCPSPDVLHCSLRKGRERDEIWGGYSTC